MPYVLSPQIVDQTPGMWNEGVGYEKKNLYSIKKDSLPPVNYDEHTLRPHSITHLETPAHTIKEGKKIDFFFEKELGHFYGKTVVIRLKGNQYKNQGNGIFHWSITKEEIVQRLKALNIDNTPDKILITSDFYVINDNGYHDPNYVLTLSQEAADYLVKNRNFNLYGTSWKSSDFNPGKNDRPIHNTIFTKAVILENLDLKNVPEGVYFICAFPLPLVGASESPVVPVLFTQHEINNFIF